MTYTAWAYHIQYHIQQHGLSYTVYDMAHENLMILRLCFIMVHDYFWNPRHSLCELFIFDTAYDDVCFLIPLQAT